MKYILYLTIIKNNRTAISSTVLALFTIIYNKFDNESNIDCRVLPRGTNIHYYIWRSSFE